MRCPKCGFHSFDYLDSCKKCGNDLTEQKLRLKFQGYVAPVAAPLPEPAGEPEALPEMAEAENEAIDFGFDVLDEDMVPAGTLPGPDGGAPQAGFADFVVDDPSAVDLAADSGLSLDRSFGEEGEAGFTFEESLPNDELPKLDKRFDF